MIPEVEESSVPHLVCECLYLDHDERPCRPCRVRAGTAKELPPMSEEERAKAKKQLAEVLRKLEGVSA